MNLNPSPDVSSAAPVRELPYLDALRGLAILLVVLVHAGGQAGLPEGTLLRLVGEARMGVQLFYMVSAVTLYLSLDSRRESGYGAYFIRRFFRLAPMYWAGVSLFVIYAVATNFQGLFWSGNFRYRWWDVVANLLLVHGFLPTALNTLVPGGWSVGVEWSFYLVLPLLYRRVRNLGSAMLAAGVAIVIMQITHAPVAAWLSQTGRGLGLVATDQQVTTFMQFYIVRQLPCFLLGIVTYYLLFPNNARPGARVTLILGYLLWIGIAGAFVVNVGVFGYKSLAHEVEVCGWYMLFFFLARQLQSGSRWLMKPLAYLGKLSYCIYLLHFLVLIGLAPRVARPLSHAMPAWLALAVLYISVLLVVIPLAILCRRIVEQPGIQLGRRLIARWNVQ